MSLDIPTVVLASFIMSIIIFMCRAAPFLFFSGKDTPAYVAFIERVMPPVAMTVLAVSSFTGLFAGGTKNFLPEIAGGVVVLFLHLWKRNTLLSILGGTIVVMVLAAYVFHR